MKFRSRSRWKQPYWSEMGIESSMWRGKEIFQAEKLIWILFCVFAKCVDRSYGPVDTIIVYCNRPLTYGNCVLLLLRRRRLLRLLLRHCFWANTHTHTHTFHFFSIDSLARNICLRQRDLVQFTIHKTKEKTKKKKKQKH